jgi:hypothetical protein
MSERDLELLLQRTAASVAYPATPQLRTRVLTAIAAPTDIRQTSSPARPSPARRPALAFATIAAAVAAFAAMVALALPGSRTAIAEFFGIEGSNVERLPTPAPGTTATPLPPAADLPQTARLAALDALASALGFEVALVEGDEPESAYLVEYGETSVAILRYQAFDLWEANLPTHFNAEKGVSEDTVVEEFMLDGDIPARWIIGGPHVLTFTDENGEDIDASFRVVERNTLIWRTDRAFYRIETTLDRDAAVDIAESLP